MNKLKNVVYIESNQNGLSLDTKRILKQKLEKNGFIVPETFGEKEVDLIICIGGDGSFIQTMHTYNFPQVPVIGINTGHLGFFQEISPYQLDEFIFKYKNGTCLVQKINTAKAVITSKDGTTTLECINEIVIRGVDSRTIHLNISLDNSFVEKFSGDGLLIATPAGSTAYNYALGGSIVDPRLNLLQITPMAPINTTAYRSFTSSVLVPPEIEISICPETTFENSILVVPDSIEYRLKDISEIKLKLTGNHIHLLRLEDYDFWKKAKSKFL